METRKEETTTLQAHAMAMDVPVWRPTCELIDHVCEYEFSPIAQRIQRKQSCFRDNHIWDIILYAASMDAENGARRTEKPEENDTAAHEQCYIRLMELPNKL